MNWDSVPPERVLLTCDGAGVARKVRAIRDLRGQHIHECCKAVEKLFRSEVTPYNGVPGEYVNTDDPYNRIIMDVLTELILLTDNAKIVSSAPSS